MPSKKGKWQVVKSVTDHTKFIVHVPNPHLLATTPTRGKKGAGKKAKAAAREKKQLKKLKKLSNVMYDYCIWDKSRGELEVIAWTLQRQVEADRGERIAMRVERDWLFEMTY